MQEINLNHNETINVGKLDYGKTYFEVKLGHNTLYSCVEKFSFGATVDLYEGKIQPNGTVMRAGRNYGWATIKEDAILNKSFFKQLPQLHDAIWLVHEYNNIVRIP